MQEVEDTLVEFLQRGASLETDVLSTLKSALPQDLAKQLDDVIPPLPEEEPYGGPYGAGGSTTSGGWGGGAGGGYGVVVDEPMAMVYTADAVADSQIGAWLREGGRRC